MTQNGQSLLLNGMTHEASDSAERIDDDSHDGSGGGGRGGGLLLDTLGVAPEMLKQKRRPSDLESLTREELIERVIALEKHVQQLRNVIAKEGSLHNLI